MNDIELSNLGFLEDPISERVEKPWGFYIDHVRTDTYVNKTLVIKPGGALSIQRHDNRNEYWTVLRGQGYILLGEYPDLLDSYHITSGFSIQIPEDEWHTVHNAFTNAPLIINEVQLGSICEESDIERA